MGRWSCAVVVLGLALLFAGPAFGGKCVTVDGYFVAASEKLLDNVMRSYVRQDTEAVMKLVNSGLVVMIKGGVPVHVEDVKLGKVMIRLPGATVPVWTVQEAVRCK